MSKHLTSLLALTVLFAPIGASALGEQYLEEFQTNSGVQLTARPSSHISSHYGEQSESARARVLHLQTLRDTDQRRLEEFKKHMIPGLNSHARFEYRTAVEEKEDALATVKDRYTDEMTRIKYEREDARAAHKIAMDRNKAEIKAQRDLLKDAVDAVTAAKAAVENQARVAAPANIPAAADGTAVTEAEWRAAEIDRLRREVTVAENELANTRTDTTAAIRVIEGRMRQAERAHSTALRVYTQQETAAKRAAQREQQTILREFEKEAHRLKGHHKGIEAVLVDLNTALSKSEAELREAEAAWEQALKGSEKPADESQEPWVIDNPATQDGFFPTDYVLPSSNGVSESKGTSRIEALQANAKAAHAHHQKLKNAKGVPLTKKWMAETAAQHHALHAQFHYKTEQERAQLAHGRAVQHLKNSKKKGESQARQKYLAKVIADRKAHLNRVTSGTTTTTTASDQISQAQVMKQVSRLLATMTPEQRAAKIEQLLRS